MIDKESYGPPLNTFDSKRNYELVQIQAIAKRNIDWYRDQGVKYVITSGGYERYLTEWRLYPYYIYLANYEEMLSQLDLMEQLGNIRIYRVRSPGEAY